MKKARRNYACKHSCQALSPCEGGVLLSGCHLPFVMVTIFEPLPYFLNLKSPLFPDLDTSMTHSLRQIFV